MRRCWRRWRFGCAPVAAFEACLPRRHPLTWLSHPPKRAWLPRTRSYPSLAGSPLAGDLRETLRRRPTTIGEPDKATQSPTPMTALAASLYRQLIGRGYGHLDTCSVLALYDRELPE